MTMKNIKKFVKEHKKEVIGAAVVAGGIALTVIGVRHRTPKQNDYTEEFCNAVNQAVKGCAMCEPMSLEELIVEIENAEFKDNKYLLNAPDKKLFDVKNIIVFGNLVEP